MTNDTTPTENGAADAAALLAAMQTETTESTSDTPAEPKAPSFDDLGLHPDVKQALDDMGYFAPTPVQTAVFHPVSQGKNLLVQSRTGTGKTTAFGLPLVNKMVPAVRQPQALILAPTRELALQVARELTNLGKHRGIVIEAVYGGAPIGKQITNLRNGVHIVVGTPGRVLDHIGRRTLDTKNISTFVLDECDEMLSMGFLEDIERVTSHLPEKHQTLLFSATMPDEVQRYARRHMTEREQISLSRDSTTVSDIHHAYYIVSGIARSRDLLKVILAEEPESAIIFCNMRDETTMVAKFLQKQGFDAEPLSSDLSQNDRERVMGRMKAKNLRFLCATDVAARGIDISNLSHVINYSVPESPEVYVHRTGRTGRAGKKGTAISLVGPRELGNFRYVRLSFGLKPEERLLPKDDIFIGKIKVPLPPIGAPQPPDPIQMLIRAVQGTASDLERQVFEKLLAKNEGKRVLAALVAEKLNQITTKTSPRRARAEAAEGEAREGGDRPRSFDGDGERPRFRDRDDRGGRGDRPRFGDRDGGDRPRFRDRDGGGEGAERPRFRDRDDRGGDRPRFRDRDRDAAAPAAGAEGAPAEGGDRPRFRDGGGEGGERGDRPRFRDRDDRGGDRGDRPRFRDRDDRGGDRGDRPRFDRDRDRGERRDRDAAPAPAAEGASTDVIGAPATGVESTPREDRGNREERFGRDRGDRGERRFDRDRDRGGRDRDRGGRDRDRDRTNVEPVIAQDATAPVETAVDPVDTTAPVAEVRAERSERPERGERDRDRGGRDRDRGGRDRDRGGRDRDRDRGERREATAEAPADAAAEPAAGVEDVARAAVDRAKKKDKRGTEVTEATREFWETWAETKTTKPAAVEEVVAEREARDEDRGERKERGGRGKDRDRGRGRGKDKDEKKAAKDDERPSRGKRDTTVDAEEAPARPARAASASAAADGNQARLFVSLGKKHGVSADDLRTLLAGPIGGDTAQIGSVSLRDSHAHVRVPEGHVDAIIAGVHGTLHNDHNVTVERARA